MNNQALGESSKCSEQIGEWRKTQCLCWQLSVSCPCQLISINTGNSLCKKPVSVDDSCKAQY